MTDLSNITKSLWFTITASIVVCFGVLFIGFYVLVSFSGQRAFSSTLTQVPFVLPDGTVYFKAVEKAPDDDRFTIPLNPLQRRFGDAFRQNLMIVGILGILTAMALGYILAQFFTEPLRKVTKGMSQLRQSTYKLSLEPTGTPEIDGMINEFNALTTKLQEAEQLRKNLISDTVHELNTPLTGLRAQLEAVQGGVLKLDKKRLGTLLDQVDRLQTLTGALQEYARLRGKQSHLQIISVPMPELVQTVLAAHQPTLDNQAITVHTKIPATLNIKADRDLMERLLTNLLQNTIRYAQATKIDITANEGTFTFTDNGIGIPKKHWPFIFERFYRVDPSRNKKTGGLGLGLAIVKEIVDAHGWEIAIEKPSQKKGITFKIAFAS